MTSRSSAQSMSTKRGHRRQLGPEHVLLALIECQPADPATALFASLGLDPVVIRERLSAA